MSSRHFSWNCGPVSCWLSQQCKICKCVNEASETANFYRRFGMTLGIINFSVETFIISVILGRFCCHSRD